MANTYNETTHLWICDVAGVLLVTGNQIIIEEIIYLPNAINENLIIQDGAGNPVVFLRAGASDISPIRWPSPPAITDGLQIQTIDGGTAQIRIRNC